VSGGIALIVFQFAFWDFYLSADVHVHAIQQFVVSVITDYAIGLAFTKMKVITPISICLTTTRRIGHVRLHQILEPLSCGWVSVFPLPKIPCLCWYAKQQQDYKNAYHG
jgi:hypothetical protein